MAGCSGWSITGWKMAASCRAEESDLSWRRETALAGQVDQLADHVAEAKALKRQTAVPAIFSHLGLGLAGDGAAAAAVIHMTGEGVQPLVAEIMHMNSVQFVVDGPGDRQHCRQ